MQHAWLLRDADHARKLMSWYRKRKPDVAGDAVEAAAEAEPDEPTSGNVVPSSDAPRRRVRNEEAGAGEEA